MLGHILACILGYFLGYIICFGVKAVMRLIIKDEASADKATAIMLLAILIAAIIFICILNL